MKKLKLAIIGAGGIATYAHAPSYENMDNVDVVCVCDIIAERAEKLAERLGAEKWNIFRRRGVQVGLLLQSRQWSDFLFSART